MNEQQKLQHTGTCQICLSEDADTECAHGKPVHSRHGSHLREACGS